MNRAALTVLAVALLTAGCTLTGRVQRRRAAVQQHKPILVVPPVDSGQTMSETALAELDAFFFQEITRLAGGAVVHATAVEEFSKALTRENLLSGGMFRVEELTAMAEAASCHSVIAARVLRYEPYKPLHITVQITWIETAGSATVNTVYLDLPMGNNNTRDQYERFVQRMVSGGGAGADISHGQLHTATLSPRTFSHFAAYRAAKEILVPPK